MERGTQPIDCYITADTIISSLGHTTAENILAMQEYQSGIRLDSSKEISETPMHLARIASSFYADRYNSTYSGLTKAEYLIAKAIEEILITSNLDITSSRLGVVLATTKGNVDLLSGSGVIDDAVYLSAIGDKIKSTFHLANPIQVISNACISGVSALILGQRLIEKATYDEVLVIGCDVLSPFIASGFLSFRSISSTVCKPYDAKRDGLNLGEACGAILLSSKPVDGGVLIAGGAISNDANHISGPSRTGYELHLAMTTAMHEAQIEAGEVSFLNLHGTATAYNDEMESKAVALSQLSEVPVQSLKSYFGHTLGASGVIETIVAAHELKSGIFLGIPGFTELGTPMPLNVSDVHRELTMKHCVKTASGFGGCNAALVLSLADSKKSKHKPVDRDVEILKTVEIEQSCIRIDRKTVFESESINFAEFIREAYKSLGVANQKFYKMDDLCKLGYIASSFLLNGLNIDPEKMGIVLTNRSSSLDTDLKHAELLANGGEEGVSPAVFVYTLPNVVLGELCIKHKIKGENTFFISNEYDEPFLKDYTRIIMNRTDLDYAVIGWCELLGDNYKAIFKLLKR